MDTQPLSGPRQVLSHIISDMAQAVSQRRDEPLSRQLARAQVAAQTIMAFLPVDAIEAMIAGHCVMFHEMIVDSIQTTLRGEPEATRRATRSAIVAMDKAFGANLLRLEQYRARDAETAVEAEPGDARAETEIADRVHRHQSGTASAEARPAVDVDGLGSIDPGHAAPEAGPLPHILGGDRPREAYAATVARMPGLNRQARRALSRQLRKCVDPGVSDIASSGVGRRTDP
jgi:hypothetical protein